jgi:Uma2 family endonuclease
MGATTTLVTVQEFLRLPEPQGQRMELIGGEIVAMGRGGRAHEFVKSNIAKVLFAWLLQNPGGRILTETAFQLDDQNSPIPDISYVSADPGSPGSTGLLQGAPELAIEVVSSETASTLENKIALYLAHGGKSVWAVFPEQRVVRVFDASGLSRKFEENQVLEGPIVLPGFQVPVTAIFEGI